MRGLVPGAGTREALARGWGERAAWHGPHARWGRGRCGGASRRHRPLSGGPAPKSWPNGRDAADRTSSGAMPDQQTDACAHARRGPVLKQALWHFQESNSVPLVTSASEADPGGPGEGRGGGWSPRPTHVKAPGCTIRLVPAREEGSDARSFRWLWLWGPVPVPRSPGAQRTGSGRGPRTRPRSGGLTTVPRSGGSVRQTLVLGEGQRAATYNNNIQRRPGGGEGGMALGHGRGARQGPGGAEGARPCAAELLYSKGKRAAHPPSPGGRRSVKGPGDSTPELEAADVADEGQEVPLRGPGGGGGGGGVHCTPPVLHPIRG